MGWLKLGAKTEEKSLASSIYQELKGATEHIETFPVSPAQRSYPFANTLTPDASLPFIPSTIVAQHNSAETGGLYIVVNNTVFDCKDFIASHPGGEQIICSFAGAECSWQFWRFHGEKEMREFGRALRVGRTEGMVNKYSEPVRWVGLRRLGGDEWN